MARAERGEAVEGFYTANRDGHNPRPGVINRPSRACPARLRC